MRKIFLLLLLVFNFKAGVAQPLPACPQPENKKALKYFKEAEELYTGRKDWDKARTLVQKAIDEAPDFADAYLLAGYLALKKKDFNNTEEFLGKAIELCETVDADAYYQLGWLQYDLKKYKESEKYLKRFLEFDKIDDTHGTHAEKILVSAKLYANPVPFEPKPLAGVTTADPEYLPYISPDNEWIYFTRRFQVQKKGDLTTTSVEKFMFSKWVNGSFDKGSEMDWPFNKKQNGNEGGASISVDNKHLFFTVNEKNNFDICTTDWTDGSWDEIKNPGPSVNDARQWDSQPSVTPDGSTLYFASARDSVTGIDIYVTHKKDDGTWTKAKKLPPSINTNGKDKSPFIHPDGKTLYYSSDSLPGLGGYDIFMTKLDDKGNWSVPMNLGYPINTEDDEVGFFVSTDGKTGYFGSNRFAGGGYDIYSFELYNKARPERTLLQKGFVTGDGGEGPIAPTIEIKDVVTQEMQKIEVDKVSGEYAFITSLDHDKLITFKKKDYAYESKYISAKDTTPAPAARQHIELKNVEVGKQYTLNDVYFATNSYLINNTTKAILEDFALYLKETPKMRVAINGHTDNVGNDKDNLLLSENRAKTIYEYLLSQNIDKVRLSYKGFGAAQPISSNATEEGRAKNRRTVFVVTAK